MKALLICPTCGYRMIGVGENADESLKAAVAGMHTHQELAHQVPLSLDRFITDLRIGRAH